MLLLSNGNGTYFDNKLLNFMKEGESDKAKDILENEKPAELIDSSRSTLLHYAAKYNADNLISYLISAGCNVDAQNKFGKTPLMLAVERSHLYVVNALFDANCDLYIVDNNGRNVLQQAFDRNSYKSFKIIDACLHALAKQCGSDNNKISEKLIEFNCPLYFAIYLKNATISKFLINRGLPINAHDPATGETALHVAVKLSDVENVKLLIEYGAEVNVKDQMGKLPIINLPNTDNEPSDNTVSNVDQDLEILSILLDRGLQITSLDYKGAMQIVNFRSHDKRFIEMIFEYDIDIMSRDAMDNTVLHCLASAKSVNFNLLEGKYFDVNARNRLKETALQLAFLYDNENLVEFLLNKGAKIDYPNVDLLCNFTPNGKIGLYGSRNIKITAKENPKFINTVMLFDEGIKFVLKHQDNIFTYSLEKKNNMMEFVLALIAMLNASKTPVSEKILAIIRKDEYFTQRVFHTYATELEQMKNEIIFDSVTLFKLLTENMNKIIGYMRNRSFLQRFEEIEPTLDANSYYINVLRKRVANAIRIAEIRAEAEIIFITITGLDITTGSIIIQRAFDYLSEKDLKNLRLVLL